MCSNIAMNSDLLMKKFVDELVRFANNQNIDITPSPSEKKAEPIPRIDPTIAMGSIKKLSEISFVGQKILNRFC